MKSIIIPITQENKLYSKVLILNNQLQAHSILENLITYTLYQVYKNNPIINNRKTHENLKFNIIQIIQQYADNQKDKNKTVTISAINNAMWKLTKKGVLIEIDGLLVLNSCFKDIDQVEQIVFRFS